MIERREPTLSGRTEADESLNRTPGNTRPTSAPAARTQTSSGSSPLAPFAVLLALASLALGAFLLAANAISTTGGTAGQLVDCGGNARHRIRKALKFNG